MSNLRTMKTVPMIALVALVLLAAPLAGEPAPVYSTLRALPIPQLASPEAIAVDAAGTVYVADTKNHRIVAHAVDGTTRLVAGCDDTRLRLGWVPPDVRAVEWRRRG
ncbi:MAG: hypothetical protein ACSLFQ_13795 [Thermoanaerobaculia bacterium]